MAGDEYGVDDFPAPAVQRETADARAVEGWAFDYPVVPDAAAVGVQGFKPLSVNPDYQPAGTPFYNPCGLGLLDCDFKLIKRGVSYGNLFDIGKV